MVWQLLRYVLCDGEWQLTHLLSLVRRTMIAEITVERKYQSRAFLILPISFSVAGTLGPCKYHLSQILASSNFKSDPDI